MARSYYYSQRQQDPKVVSITPSPFPVIAVFRDHEGKIFTEDVYLIAVFSDGDVKFIFPDEDGLFTCPDDMYGFEKYIFPKTK